MDATKHRRPFNHIWWNVLLFRSTVAKGNRKHTVHVCLFVFGCLGLVCERRHAAPIRLINTKQFLAFFFTLQFLQKLESNYGDRFHYTSHTKCEVRTGECILSLSSLFIQVERGLWWGQWWASDEWKNNQRYWMSTQEAWDDGAPLWLGRIWWKNLFK